MYRVVKIKHLFQALLFLLLVPLLGISQNIKNYIREADAMFQKGEYYNAALNYKKALELDSSLLDIQYRYADMLREVNDHKKAAYWYNKVYLKDKGLKYPDAPFWLAMCKMYDGKYKESKKLFDKYAKKFKKKKTYLALKAQQQSLACDFAQLAMASKNDVAITHLDNHVNSVHAEFGAYELFDTLLYFSSLRDNVDSKNAKLYSVNDKKDTLRDTQVLDELFNNPEYHNVNTAFNHNFTRFYFTRCKNESPAEVRCEIYVRELKDGKWQDAEKLPEQVNAEGYTTTQPNIGYNDSTKQEVLYFASDRPNGEGKMDVWGSIIWEDGTYGKPFNAGKKVNSIDNEVTPFYCNKCQVLFFSSDWHKGLGGFDIFSSKQIKNNFSEPENMGYPVNSSENDLYYTINTKGNKAYFTSNRDGALFLKNENCCNDIWMYKLPFKEDTIIPPVKIIVDSTQVFIKQMKLLVPLTLYFHNDEPDNKTLNITTTKNYKKTYDDYSALRDKYKTEYSNGLSGESKEKAQFDIDNFFEDSVDAGMQDLEKFAKLMVKVLLDSEHVKITMKGYCSPLASTSYNVNLAKRRISSLRNYFMEYDNGYFKKYVDNPNPNEGSIEFFNEDIGELKASPNVSDNPNDQKNSVYSRAAAVERKIQIIAISTQ